MPALAGAVIPVAAGTSSAVHASSGPAQPVVNSSIFTVPHPTAALPHTRQHCDAATHCVADSVTHVVNVVNPAVQVANPVTNVVKGTLYDCCKVYHSYIVVACEAEGNTQASLNYFTAYVLAHCSAV